VNFSYKFVGWRRDLTREGVESNPDPIRWGPIAEQFRKELGTLSQEQEKELENLPDNIKYDCKLGPLDVLDETHVKKYFEKNPSHPFANAMMGIIVMLRKSAQLSVIQGKTFVLDLDVPFGLVSGFLPPTTEPVIFESL
jgi:hypothetical protein